MEWLQLSIKTLRVNFGNSMLNNCSWTKSIIKISKSGTESGAL